MKNIYIFSIGKLVRKHNNVYFVNKEGKKKPLPIEAVSNIFILNKVSLTYNAIKLLLDRNIFIHLFYENEKKGIFYYLGTISPRHKHPAGIIHVKQAEAYLNQEKRAKISLEIIDALRYNCIKVIEKYPEAKEETIFLRSFNVFRKFEENFNHYKDFKFVITGIESTIWNYFYSAIDKILKYFKLERRTKRPPKNEANAIVSFSNQLLYSIVISEIYKTHLDPTISFLHEPFERRFSLALDLAEPFKPIITFRTLIWLINQNVVKEGHFVKGLNGILLNEFGKKKVIEEFEKRLNETVKLKNRPKRSIRFYIRLQCYSLERFLIEGKEFKAFRLIY